MTVHPSEYDLSPAERGRTVSVEFLVDVRGTRNFPLASKNSYRFDSGANRIKKMPKYDAVELISRWGESKFRILGR